MSTLYNVNHPRRIIPDLSSDFHQKGWVFAYGGALSVKQGNLIYVPPANFSPSKLTTDHLFALTTEGKISLTAEKSLALTPVLEAPIFVQIFAERKPGAVLFSCSNKVIVACELIKGYEFIACNQHAISGTFDDSTKNARKFSDTVVIPVINDGNDSSVLEKKIRACLQKYPSTSAILVRGRGLLCWAQNSRLCNASAECYHQLLELFIESEKLGITGNFENEYQAVTEAVNDEDLSKLVTIVKVHEEPETEPVKKEVPVNNNPTTTIEVKKEVDKNDESDQKDDKPANDDDAKPAHVNKPAKVNTSAKVKKPAKANKKAQWSKGAKNVTKLGILAPWSKERPPEPLMSLTTFPQASFNERITAVPSPSGPSKKKRGKKNAKNITPSNTLNVFARLGSKQDGDGLSRDFLMNY